MKPISAIRDFFSAGVYRTPLPVTETHAFRDGSYAVCPRCRSTLPREYISYCDRCGQRLNWDRF